MVPNVLTLLALCAGMTAIRFAMNGNFIGAVFAIIVAGIFDGLDGRIARLLKSTSSFGAELDSLSDFVSFGVAPAAVLYLWTMSGLRGLGWAIVLFYAVCCALAAGALQHRDRQRAAGLRLAVLYRGAGPGRSRARHGADVFELRMGRLGVPLALSERADGDRGGLADGQQGADRVVEAAPRPPSPGGAEPARRRSVWRLLSQPRRG